MTTIPPVPMPGDMPPDRVRNSAPFHVAVSDTIPDRGPSNTTRCDRLSDGGIRCVTDDGHDTTVEVAPDGVGRALIRLTVDGVEVTAALPLGTLSVIERAMRDLTGSDIVAPIVGRFK